ncbi:MAG TPA: serine/threonine-protein kinase, partial [Kofleriaceae bacterium]
MIESKTQIRGSGPDTNDPTEPPVEPKCPRCQQPTQGLPFCPTDGQLVGKSFTVGSRYVINELLGAGGTALVFGGHDELLGRQIALKLLRPQYAGDADEAARFLRAAKLVSQLHHENIVVVHDCGEDTDLGVVYLVMERLIGATLAEVKGKTTRLSWQRTIRILVQVCRALGRSHEQGILHRDLSLRNITLVTSSGRADVVKLCDFGLARTTQGDDRVTSTGTAVGTPAYMAPELVRGDADQNHRVDIYALGVIAYELLSGKLPHESATMVAMIARKLTAPPTPLSEACPGVELPPGLETLIMACLEHDPSARPESASLIERDLLALDPESPRAGGLVGQVIGNHRVVERLAQGGMGEIYLVEHEVIGTKAALKVLLPEIATNPEAVERFIQEARASGNIPSPHIPRCYDLGFLPDKRAYVLMDLIEGESVAAEIKRAGPMSLADVKQVVRQTAGALAAAHDLGIIHRDIKPEHIMIQRGSAGLHVKLLDFGIAKIVTDTTTRTQVGVFMGTPLYCAPEQVLGEPVGPATDAYALGATAYEMLTGRPPFSGEAGHVLALKTTRDPVPLIELRPGLPPAVTATINRMMARDPAHRPNALRPLAAEVAKWPEVEKPVVAILKEEPAPPPVVRRPRWWLYALPTACVVIGLSVWLWPRPEAKAPAADPAPITTPNPPPVAPRLAPVAPKLAPVAPPAVAPPAV